MNKTFNKSKIKVAAFDVDGTIFHDGRISDAVKDAITKLHETGVITVLATGRMHYYIPKSVMDLGVFKHGVLGNGTVVWDFESSSQIAASPFEREVAENTLRYLDSLTDAYFIDFANESCLTSRHLELLREEIKLEVLKNGGEAKEPHTIYDNLLARVSGTYEPIFKMGGRFDTVEGRKIAMDKINELGNIEISSTGGKDVGITPCGVHKGSGVLTLCEHLGLDISNVIAFGDGGNDVDLLKIAGFAVVLGNGQDSAKEVADHITEPVWEDGVALAIKELFEV